MSERSRRELPFGLEAPETPSGSQATEDLLFIGRMTPLSPVMRTVYEMWAKGADVSEISHSLDISRSTAWRTLRAALVRCWMLGPPAFDRLAGVCDHRPQHRSLDACRTGARCEVCAAPLWEDYERETCGSPECEEVMRQRRSLDRRRLLFRRNC